MLFNTQSDILRTFNSSTGIRPEWTAASRPNPKGGGSTGTGAGGGGTKDREIDKLRKPLPDNGGSTGTGAGGGGTKDNVPQQDR